MINKKLSVAVLMWRCNERGYAHLALGLAGR